MSRVLKAIHYWHYDWLGPRFQCGTSTKNADRCCHTNSLKLVTCKRCLAWMKRHGREP